VTWGRGVASTKKQVSEGKPKLVRMTGAERRAQIIDVVLRLVNDHGVEGTTTARIARAAGVTEPTLYQYFESRRDMLLAGIDAVFERTLEVLESSDEPDVVERLRGIGAYHTRETAAKRLRFIDPLFEFMVAPRSEGLRDRVRAGNLETVSFITSLVEEGKAQGRIRADVDARRVAWKVMSFYWFEDVSSLMDLDEVMSHGISTEVLESILAGIVVES
jgi:AcrR family transcriptional regulator